MKHASGCTYIILHCSLPCQGRRLVSSHLVSVCHIRLIARIAQPHSIPDSPFAHASAAQRLPRISQRSCAPCDALLSQLQRSWFAGKVAVVAAVSSDALPG